MNDILYLFKAYLFSQKLSKATVKNYISDISRFISWYENVYSAPFSPQTIHKDIIIHYQNASQQFVHTASSEKLSSRSFDRHVAALKKFFFFLKEQGLSTINPFQEIEMMKHTAPSSETSSTVTTEPINLKNFKDYLYTSHASAKTIKNYLLDIKQFLSWLEQVSASNNEQINIKDLYKLITTATILTYKNRLLSDAGFSPISVNRKLSSLRKFVTWLYKEGLIGETHILDLASISNLGSKTLTQNNIDLFSTNQENQSKLPNTETQQMKRSKFPPIRVFFALLHGVNSAFDFLIILPVAKSYERIQYTLFKVKRIDVFKPITTEKNRTTAQNTSLDTLIMQKNEDGKQEVVIKSGLITFSNISKRFYDPLAVSLNTLPIHKRIYHNLRHKRPEWYKKYHKNPVVHYLHFSLLLIYVCGLVFWMQYHFFNETSQQSPVFASVPLAPPRYLSFKGRLTDDANDPITASSALRFSLYNSMQASGSALLWQDVITVTPDQYGNFIATLGKDAPITDDMFVHNPNLYVGITLGTKEEMNPRQKIATTGLASDSQSVQGMQPITLSGESANSLLALDSAGNLSIGGHTGTTFQTTDGDFHLTGQSLLLSTNQGSNGNLVLNPDGNGFIDMQKPLQNTGNFSNLPSAAGSVEVDDTFAILASSSAVAALNLEQDSTANLISASSSGTAKFTLDYQGNAMIAGSLALNGDSLTSNQTSFNFLPDSVLSLHIGDSATEVSIGAATGSTSIQNSLYVNGNTTLGSNAANNIFLKGVVASDILPAQNSKFDIGSPSAAFNNAYLTNMFLSPTATTSGFLHRDSGAISFINQGDAFVLGGSNPTNALIKLAGVSGQDSYLNAGKVGIGTTNTLTDALQVYGDVRVGTATTDGCLKRYDGTALAGTCSSDMRLKKNIKPIENVLDKFTALQPVTYNMRADEFPQYGFGNGTEYGLIAQQVEQLFPQLVETDKNGFKMVKYGPELAMLGIEATRELYAQVQDLHTKVTGFSQPINSNGDILTVKDDTGTYVVKNQQGDIFTATAALARAVIGQLNVGLITAKEGVFDGLAVATDKLTIAGVSLRDYILNTVNNSALSNTTSITTPLLSADNVKSNFISPLAEDSLISIGLENSEVTIRNGNTASSAAVARFDREGNATLSGSLTTQGINTNNASVSGTLHAGKIIADEIDGLDAKLATLSATASPAATQVVTNIYNIYNNASNSATPNEQTNPSFPSDNVSSMSGQFSFLNAPINSSFTQLGSNSAALAYVPNLNTNSTTVTNSLMVLGETSVDDISVTGQLSIGGGLILADNAINVLGSPLHLQPLRQGTLDIMGGLVAIDTDGNLSVGGNATFAKDVSIKGTLATNLIAPVPGADLVIQLPGSEAVDDVIVNNAETAAQQAAKRTAFVIKNASGSGVLAINNLGDIIASGTAAFKDIAAGSLHIVRGAQADTSAIDTVASGSAGVASITAGYTSRTIFSPYVKENSLIYITPRSQTANAVPYLSRQNANDPEHGIQGSFTVQIPNVSLEDVEFNWWIIN